VTLFIEWEVSLERWKPGKEFHGGVQSKRGAAHVGGGVGVGAKPGGEGQAADPQSLAQRLPERGPGGSGATAGAATGAVAGESACLAAGGRGADSRVGAQGGAAGAGD